MSLHPILLEKLLEAVRPAVAVPFTPRHTRLPDIANKVHAVIGMRRVGKTTFLRQLHYQRQQALGPERSVFISFDDDRLADQPLAQLDFLLEEYYRNFPSLRSRETVHWFLDEIQFVDGWERFVRRILDTEKVEVVVSGSSARLLSREVHTSLRGRGLATIIRPFSFREYLCHRGEEPSQSPGRFTAAERSLIEKRFREYLTTGGFPEAQGLAAALRVELLQGYVDTMILRDIIERFGVRQIAALRWLVRQALRNPAGLMSVHRLYLDIKSQGLTVSKDALHAMLGYLEDAFLVTTVPLATESERRRNSNPRKIYPADVALIGAFDRSGRPNLGHALETVVFHELERRRPEIGYVKTASGLEVDFYARYFDGREELIQVCADLSEAKTRERELRALTEARREYPQARAKLMVINRDQAASITTPDVMVQTAYQWLLEENENP